MYKLYFHLRIWYIETEWVYSSKLTPHYSHYPLVSLVENHVSMISIFTNKIVGLCNKKIHETMYGVLQIRYGFFTDLCLRKQTDSGIINYYRFWKLVQRRLSQTHLNKSYQINNDQHFVNQSIPSKMNKFSNGELLTTHWNTVKRL